MDLGVRAVGMHLSLLTDSVLRSFQCYDIQTRAPTFRFQNLMSRTSSAAREIAELTLWLVHPRTKEICHAHSLQVALLCLFSDHILSVA